MQDLRDPIPAFDPEADDGEPRPLPRLTRTRVITMLAVMAALVLLALVPPLINLNRYKRQIASGIGASLGRPVHLDSVTLTLLPMPGFTIENFVVGEDPAFGSEPVIRANEVRATLRISSLWNRRVEISRIDLVEPSVNLVHRPDGQWNLESILLRASQAQVAPTGQRSAGAAPRFPYIQATGARVNFKREFEKLPFSLTEADFALWLPGKDEWHLRLKGRSVRTDTAATDAGVIRLEGTLGRAATLGGVPLTMRGEWATAPLGAVSTLFFGRDLGVRGDLAVTASVQGTMGRNRLETHLQMAGVRRSDFVPDHPLSVDLSCTAQAVALFHRMEDAACEWPQGAAAGSGVSLVGRLPDVFHPGSASGSATVKSVPASVLLDLLHAASPRVARDLTLAGTLSGTLSRKTETSPSEEIKAKDRTGTRHAGALPARSRASAADPQPVGGLTLLGANLALAGQEPFVDQTVTFDLTTRGLTSEPILLALGGREPAALSVSADPTGLTLHLTGSATRARLLSLAAALPQFGDGLADALPAVPASPAVPAASASSSAGSEAQPAVTDGSQKAEGANGPLPEAPLRLDLVAHRPWLDGQTRFAGPSWFGGQTWTAAQSAPQRRSRRAR